MGYLKVQLVANEYRIFFSNDKPAVDSMINHQLQKQYITSNARG